MCGDSFASRASTARSFAAVVFVSAPMWRRPMSWPPTRGKKPKRKGLDFLKLQREFRLPAELPVIDVHNVDFPDIRLDLTRQMKDQPTQRVALQKFSAHFVDVVLDPQQPVTERRPLFSKQIALAAEELAIGSGDEIGELQAHGSRPRRGKLHPHRAPGGAHRQRAALAQPPAVSPSLGQDGSRQCPLCRRRPRAADHAGKGRHRAHHNRRPGRDHRD